MTDRPTIYVVTSGEYSDYGIGAVFTEKLLAEQFVAVCGGNIEEWVANQRVDPGDGTKSFVVRIQRDGRVLEAKRMQDDFAVGDGSADVVSGREGWLQNPLHLYCEMWARDKAHAIKIANERRTAAVLRGDFDK